MSEADGGGRPGELAGKVAIVTGAAGGIGTEIVDRFLAEGASVVGGDIDPIPERDTERFASIEGDAATTGTARRATVAAACELFGGLDILVNVAGRFLGKGIEETSDDEWDQLMVTNVRSAFVHCREAIPALLAGEPGNIVTIGSISGIAGLQGQGAYSATKAAVAQLTRQIAIEYADRGLRANVVAPGAIDTKFVARSRPSSALEVPPGTQAERLRNIRSSYPLGRIATPREIADVVCFLASPRASFITGAVISADGGYLAR